MPKPDRNKHRFALWRVNVDGIIYEGRWAHASGAVAGALYYHCGANYLKREQRREFTDMVIHVQQIGDPLPYENVEPVA